MQAAVRWVRANAAARRLDPDRIATAGFSAGATMSVADRVQQRRPGEQRQPGLLVAGHRRHRHGHPRTSRWSTSTRIRWSSRPSACSTAPRTSRPYLGPVATCLVAQAMLNVCEVRQYAGRGPQQPQRPRRLAGLPRTAGWCSARPPPSRCRRGRSPPSRRCGSPPPSSRGTSSPARSEPPPRGPPDPHHLGSSGQIVWALSTGMT